MEFQEETGAAGASGVVPAPGASAPGAVGASAPGVVPEPGASGALDAIDPSQVGVVFDCDGTLIDSMTGWRTVEAELADRAGVTLTREDVDTIAALTIGEVGEYYHGKFGLGDSSEEVVGLINEAMMDFYTTRSEPLPGALELVRGLAERGAHVSVASSTPKPLLVAALEHCGFAPYLDAVFSVDDVGVSKRESVVYEAARQAMGTPLASTWGVEDAAYALRTLRSGGFRTIGVHDNDLSATMEELTALADHAVESLADVSADDVLAWTEA